MSNKNPSPETRFGAQNGNTPGRKHTKDKLSQSFLKDLQEVWEKDGKAVLERLAAEGDTKANAALAKIVASMEPKEVQHHHPMGGMDDDQLQRVIDLLQKADGKATLQ